MFHWILYIIAGLLCVNIGATISGNKKRANIQQEPIKIQYEQPEPIRIVYERPEPIKLEYTQGEPIILNYAQGEPIKVKFAEPEPVSLKVSEPEVNLKVNQPEVNLKVTANPLNLDVNPTVNNPPPINLTVNQPPAVNVTVNPTINQPEPLNLTVNPINATVNPINVTVNQPEKITLNVEEVVTKSAPKKTNTTTKGAKFLETPPQPNVDNTSVAVPSQTNSSVDEGQYIYNLGKAMGVLQKTRTSGTIEISAAWQPRLIETALTTAKSYLFYMCHLAIDSDRVFNYFINQKHWSGRRFFFLTSGMYIVSFMGLNSIWVFMGL